MENTLDHSRLQSLPKDLVDPPQGKAVRIYSDGIFDLFHFGHAQALEQAKKTFDDVYLLVGVCNDETTHQYKGKTVMNEQERYLSVKHCKWVDQVIPDAPWIINQEFLDKHQIDYVAHDDLPYKSEQCDDVYQFVKNQGRFIPTKRTQGVSTSDVITRIVRDYDVFVKRNLDRGITAEELNIPFLKQKEIELKKIKQQITQKVQQSEHKLTENYVRAKKELPLTVQQSLSFCEETSQALVQRFITWFYAVKR